MAKDTAIDYIKQAFNEVVKSNQPCVAINETTGIITIVENNANTADKMSQIRAYIIILQGII